MAKLSTDSPICLRIVLAFLDFLTMVQLAPGVDPEGLEVVHECLEDIFKVNRSSLDNKPPKGILVNLFSSPEASEENEGKSQTTSPAAMADIASTSSGGVAASGVPKEELFERFSDALSLGHFFNLNESVEAEMERMKQIFDSAIAELKKSGCEIVNFKNLAEILKTQGNNAMLANLHSEAIDLYTCAIALCGDNAIYYCNRAAAYTKIQEYDEAIRDCLASIELNPKYSKAYCRLGLAYHEQGNFIDAIFQGYVKALKLDPNHESTHHNIRVAEQELREEYQQMKDTIRALALHNNHQPIPMSQAIGPQAVPFTYGPSNFALLPPSVQAAVAAMFIRESEDDEPVNFGEEEYHVDMTMSLWDLINFLPSMFLTPYGDYS